MVGVWTRRTFIKQDYILSLSSLLVHVIFTAHWHLYYLCFKMRELRFREAGVAWVASSRVCITPRPAELLACVLATRLHSLSSRSKEWVHLIHILQSVKRTYELELLSANSLRRYFGPQSKLVLKSHFTLSAAPWCL